MTLTYDEKNLPDRLKKEHLQKFIRNLRDDGKEIKYFACGEYGDTTNRPHYHMCIFGSDFRDGTEFKINDELYGVPYLNARWAKGSVVVADFSMATARS